MMLSQVLLTNIHIIYFYTSLQILSLKAEGFKRLFLLLSFFSFLKFYVYRCFAFVCVWHHIYAVPREARRGPWILVAGMTDGCKLPCGCWQSNL